MNILICGNTQSFFEHERKIHYSVRKSLGFAIGLKNCGHNVYVLSRNYCEKYDGISHISYRDIDRLFLESIDLIFFTVEGHFEKCIKRSKGLSWLVDQKYRDSSLGPKIIVKTGKETFLERTERGIEFYGKVIDYFLLQEKAFAESCRENIKGISDAKVYFSTMGTLNSPYPQTESPYSNGKINLLYMGRMRQSPSRMPFMMKMAKHLGEDYCLNILPGTFSKPGHEGRNKWGPEKDEPFRWLCNYFSKNKNIVVHEPKDWGIHWSYIYHADVGIDFSPFDKEYVHPAGNAKLLEYLTAGLPSVTEYTTGNAHLITDSMGGEIVNSIRSIKDYCSAVKIVGKREYDRKKIARLTMKNHSWNKKAKDAIFVLENNICL